MFLVLLSLIGASLAGLDCKALNIAFMDQTFEIEQRISTPPLKTDVRVLFNPCSAVKGEPACNKDDNFCVIETIDDKVVAVKSIGSVEAGCQSGVTYGHAVYGPGFPTFAISYHNAKWGDYKLSGHAVFYCAETRSEPRLTFEDSPQVIFTGPEFCLNETDAPEPGYHPIPPPPRMNMIHKILIGSVSALFLILFVLYLKDSRVKYAKGDSSLAQIAVGFPSFFVGTFKDAFRSVKSRGYHR